MTLVRRICDHVYVLDFGELIFEGSPEEMLHRSRFVPPISASSQHRRAHEPCDRHRGEAPGDQERVAPCSTIHDNGRRRCDNRSA